MAVTDGASLKTRIIPVQTTDFGTFKDPNSLEKWQSSTAADLTPLHEAAAHLRSSNIPVGFPTETVYGLGADATRSDAVKGIYKAKGRPSDNPLIVHVCDLTMLRCLLVSSTDTNGQHESADHIPKIYKPLIERFWPGPLTILLPNPNPSKLAPEVTAGLPSFGARMPNSPLALSLINLAGVPLAAPSANASTKPSPTTAEHVLHDLDGRIEIVLDGGPCQVGVESTVVDGLCDPPVILRPGGVSIDGIRECEGWQGVVIGYKDQSEVGAGAPRAPGMKYKHYSPKAKVVLYEAPSKQNEILQDWMPWELPLEGRRSELAAGKSSTPPVSIGIVSTRYWKNWCGSGSLDINTEILEQEIRSTLHLTSNGLSKVRNRTETSIAGTSPMRLCEFWRKETPTNIVVNGNSSLAAQANGNGITTILQNDGVAPKPLDDSASPRNHLANIIQISLGCETRDIAHGLFSALRELDQRGVDVIYVEGIDDGEDIAAAVMNRLRKAASVIVK